MKTKAKSFTNLEEIVNKLLNLSSTKGSGSVHNDGDGRGFSEDYDTSLMLLAECKYTEKEKGTVSFKKTDFNKIHKSAINYGRLPLLATSDRDGQIYIMMKIEDFERIYNKE